MSRASTSGVRRAKAFLVPSGLIKALTTSPQTKNQRYIPDQGVNLDTVNVVELLKSLLDLALVGLDVDNEDEGVVLLDLLHGGLGVQGVQNNTVEVQSGTVGNGNAGVLGGPRELEGLGAVEGRGGADLAGLVKLLPQPR
jgi:hypothetical protein